MKGVPFVPGAARRSRRPSAAISYYDSKREPRRRQEAGEGVRAASTSDKIERVTVKSAAGDQTTVEKQGNGVADDAAGAGGRRRGRALRASRRTWRRSRSSAWSTIRPTDLKQYGLDPARIEVTFKFAGKEQKLPARPEDADRRRISTPRSRTSRACSSVASYLEATFNKSSFDLRDKTILKIDREKVDRVEIETPDRTVKVAKQGADWRISSPVDARADFGAVEGIIGRLNTTPMKAITAAEATDLTEYGLDKPAATVRVMSGSAQAGLRDRQEPPGEGVVYAKDLVAPDGLHRRSRRCSTS